MKADIKSEIRAPGQFFGSTLRIHAPKTQEKKTDLEGAEAESQSSSNKGLKQACGCPGPHSDQSLM